MNCVQLAGAKTAKWSVCQKRQELKNEKVQYKGANLGATIVSIHLNRDSE